MSTFDAQADGLKKIAKKLQPGHLTDAGVTGSSTEAQHLILMLKDASELLDKIARCDACSECGGYDEHY